MSGSRVAAGARTPRRCEPGEAIASSQTEGIRSGATSLLLAPED